MSILDEIYRDGIDLTTEELYKVEEKGTLPTTSTPVSPEFI